MGRDHLRRKRAAEDVVFGNSSLQLRTNLNRPTFPRIAPREAAGVVWRGVYFSTLLSSAQSTTSSLHNRGVKQFDHCIHAILNSGWYKFAGHVVYRMN